MLIGKFIRLVGDREHSVFCPGCQKTHFLDRRWIFDGNTDSPSFMPSVKSTEPDCHAFISKGYWEFLRDCTHQFKNQKVPMTELRDE